MSERRVGRVLSVMFNTCAGTRLFMRGLGIDCSRFISRFVVHVGREDVLSYSACILF